MNRDTTLLLEQLREELAGLRDRIAVMENNIDTLQKQLEEEAAAREIADTEAVDLSAISLEALPEKEAPVEAPAPVEVEIVVPEEPAPVVEDLPVSEPEEILQPEPEPAPAPKPEPKPAEKPVQEAVADSTDRYAWRKDMPGSPVRDIRSAIALNDRVLFINLLFQQDAVRFQNVLNALNALESFVEAESYLRSEFPQWNYDSEVVYRFMMAVRRKLR